MKKYIAYIFSVVYMVFIYFLSEWIDYSPIVVIASLVLYVAAIFAIGYFTNVEIVEEKLKKDIIKTMKYEGYECAMEEGVLVYQMHGRKYNAYFWKTGKKSFRIEILDYGNIDEDWNKISLEGKSVLANYINQEYPQIKMVTAEKGVVFSYVTAISGGNEFLEKAQLSYNAMNETISRVFDVYPKIKERYSEKEQNRPIGFVNKELNEEKQ